MGEPKGRRNRHNAGSHHDSDEVRSVASHDGSQAGRYGDVHDARNAAEERVRVLEQYIKDMSIQNMQRMQASAQSSTSTDGGKWEKECKKKDEEIVKLKALVVAQGTEASETKRQLETMKREHAALRDQFEIGCRRLAYHTTRYLTENAKWDLTASTTSTVSTVSTISLSHSSTNSVASGETDDFFKEPHPPTPNPDKVAKQDEMDTVPLRAEDTADYGSFPSADALQQDALDFMKRLRSDLRRIALPDSVRKGAKDSSFTIGSLRANSTENLLSEQGPTPTEADEVLKSVEERVSRVLTEMRGLYGKLGSLPDLHLIDPVQIIQTTSASLTRMLHDIEQITPPVRDVLLQSRKVLAESGPVSRRLRLAESDLKIKEQRHGLKVELLEKRLGRLTSTLTSVQQETWSSRRADDNVLQEALGAALLERDGAALANQPEEYRQFLELLSDREQELRRAEKQVAETGSRAEQLEQQVVDLAIAKFDAEMAAGQAKSEEEYWSAKSKEQECQLRSVHSTPQASPTIPGTSPHADLFAGLFATAPAFSNPHLDVSQTLAGLGLPPPPAFAAMAGGYPAGCPPPYYGLPPSMFMHGSFGAGLAPTQE